MHPQRTVLPEACREIDRACIVFFAAEGRAENLQTKPLDRRIQAIGRRAIDFIALIPDVGVFDVIQIAPNERRKPGPHQHFGG